MILVLLAFGLMAALLTAGPVVSYPPLAKPARETTPAPNIWASPVAKGLKINAEGVVAAAVASLVRGDIAGHLAYIADDVVVQFNENPPVRGKDAYRQIREVGLDLEPVTDFVVGETVTEADGAVIVRVDEDHEWKLRQQNGRIVVKRETLPSYYTVQGSLITKWSIS